VLPLAAPGAPPQNAADQPYIMEYYYKVQWGHQQEFLQTGKEIEAEKLYFTQVKCTGTLFDNFCSGEITFSCTHSSTILPGLPNFHLWLTALTPGRESLR